jgi:DNA-binding MarR family transcriptional regulator
MNEMIDPDCAVRPNAGADEYGNKYGDSNANTEVMTNTSVSEPKSGTTGGGQTSRAEALRMLEEQFVSLLGSHRGWLRRHNTQRQGLSASEYAFLYVIGERHSLRPSDPDLSLHFSSATISHYAIRLERQGLLARDPDPGDRRGRLLTLTPMGLERLSRTRNHYMAFLTDALSTWPRSDIDRIQQFLALMNTSTE